MKSLGRYRIESELARGGMGVVYRARDGQLGREVAIKLLLAERQTSDSAHRRFAREAEALGRLKHPHIVRVHEVGHDRGHPYLVLDLVDGVSLEQRIQQSGPLGAVEAAAVAKKLALALQHAHERGVLHRDVKPSNVLLDAASTEPRLTDFGLAKEIDSDSALSKSGRAMGSPGFWPPELARGESRLASPASDVFSLGATLHFSICGQPPFSGQTLAEAVIATCAQDATPLSELVPGVSPDLEAIVLTCLEKGPERRYRSAEDLAQDLERFLSGRPTEALARQRAQQRQRLLLRLAAGLGLVCLAGLGIVAGSQISRADPATAPSPSASVAASPLADPVTGPVLEALAELDPGDGAAGPSVERAEQALLTHGADELALETIQELSLPSQRGRLLLLARVLRDELELARVELSNLPARIRNRYEPVAKALDCLATLAGLRQQLLAELGGEADRPLAADHEAEPDLTTLKVLDGAMDKAHTRAFVIDSVPLVEAGARLLERLESARSGAVGALVADRLQLALTRRVLVIRAADTQLEDNEFAALLDTLRQACRSRSTPELQLTEAYYADWERPRSASPPFAAPADHDPVWRLVRGCLAAAWLNHAEAGPDLLPQAEAALALDEDQLPELELWFGSDRSTVAVQIADHLAARAWTLASRDERRDGLPPEAARTLARAERALQSLVHLDRDLARRARRDDERPRAPPRILLSLLTLRLLEGDPLEARRLLTEAEAGWGQVPLGEPGWAPLELFATEIDLVEGQPLAGDAAELTDPEAGPYLRLLRYHVAHRLGRANPERLNGLSNRGRSAIFPWLVPPWHRSKNNLLAVLEGRGYFPSQK